MQWSARGKSTGSSSARADPIIAMRGIVKRFGAVQALKGVDLDLYPGEVLGLVGDNSAGKSTLMKILTGAYRPDAGADLLSRGAPSPSIRPTIPAARASR